jgi:hypothetical protein
LDVILVATRALRVPADRGLAFHELRRVRPASLFAAIFFLVAVLGLAVVTFLAQGNPAAVVPLAIGALFLYLLQRSHVDIRLDSQTLRVRRGIHVRVVPLREVKSVHAGIAHVPTRTGILWPIPLKFGWMDSEPAYWDATDLVVRTTRGRPLRFTSIEPAAILRLLQELLPASVERTGKGWNKWINIDTNHRPVSPTSK